MADEARPSRKIALWGEAGTGKTMLLARLNGANFEVESDWDMVTKPQGARFLASIEAPLRANRFPPATNGVPSEAWYEFRHAITGRVATLSVDDRPGRNWRDLDTDAVARLREADGILMLIDVEWNEQEMLAAVVNAANHLANEGGARLREPRPVAICLSKIDGRIRSRAEIQDLRADPERYARQRGWLPASLDRLFRMRFERHRVFPLSAAGVFELGSMVEPAAFYDEELALRFRSDGACIDLLAPFTWLFDAMDEKRP